MDHQDLHSRNAERRSPDAAHGERLMVHGQTQPRLRVVPARLILHAPDSDPPSAESYITILSRDPNPDLVVEFEQKGRIPATITRIRSDNQGRRTVYSVRRAKGKRALGAEFTLLVRSASSQGDFVRVPILLPAENQP